ncbi:MAG: histidinol-phosphate transaminase [Spirochaetales bacterium]|nr:histidinol-phosphate transaminase [Spirochaetales bacterium]
MKLRKNLTGITPYIAGKLKEGAVKLASNENPLGSSPKAIESVRRFLDKIWLYPDSNCEAIKAKLARAYGVTEDMLIIGNGSDEILLFIAGAYIEEGLNAVTSEATFSEYTFATTLFAGVMRYAPMKDFTYHLPALASLIDEKTRVVFCANPNNPTGTYFTGKEFDDFIKDVPETVLIVVDEAYVEYVTEKDFPDTLSRLKERDNILILRTFSKLYGLAGLRIGYGIGGKKVIADLHKTKEPFNINSIAQVAATAALDDHEFVKKSLTVNNEGKKYLYGEFDAMGLWYLKSAANFIFLRIGMDCREAFQTLMERGVTIRPIPVLGMPDGIRVTVGTEEQNRLFINLLKELLRKK